MTFFGPSCPDSSLLGFGAALLAGKTPREP